MTDKTALDPWLKYDQAGWDNLEKQRLEQTEKRLRADNLRDQRE